MLNYLWGFMIVIGIIVAAFTGTMGDVTQTAINSSKEAVQICITLLGVLGFWMGIMKIAEKSGLISSLTNKIRPILRFLFPDVPDGHDAQKYIATNLIANVLGLGWAATPPGLLAMKALQKLNPKKDEASNAMCMFLIVNISSVQLISVNIIAYRSQYGSVNPSEVIGPSLLATCVSTLVAVVFGKLMERRKRS
ncbi:nucleoside recognition domain-containing protein [Defluviitalea raffinosedens]|jgi:spore maturation protein A|uniref:Nucleoside recognition protein n=1 Tax=Defluviitalea raffinosedens TaxID=1450156 RepID=A0A7C8HE60_9FIRM|nr:nucleoside recognition domain-containing protein [Defluviitalea raffinosedens]KAE9628759.1 nucleoside recognition protein [Defluviitalea raffinosedens]MBM7686837.1 spore maturation protein A [Defluviitalea raffinosedens]HHW66110.1 nucleoside recognition protein [Candidatus Epulonipiscium sp.]